MKMIGSRLAEVAAFLSISPDRPELLQAQAKALARQLPLLYIILTLNTAMLGYSFYGRAPDLLTIIVPGGASILCVIRGLRWWALKDEHHLAIDVIVRLLRRSVWHSMVLGIGFSVWALALTLYGDALTAAHVEFYMSITVIACAFCLMHVPAAALTLTVCVLAPFCSVFLWRADKEVVLIAANAALVFGALLLVLTTYYRDFVNLIESRKDLLSKQVEAGLLYAENVRLANLDILTGLPSRRLFFEHLDAHVAGSTAAKTRLAVALIDLDGFKPVNDVYGHAAGDKVLVQAADRIAKHASTGVASRLGGDEFAVVIDPVSDEASLLEWAQAICSDLCRPYELDGSTTRLSASIGLATTAAEPADPGQLMERADYALYYSKRHAPGTAAIFSEEHEQQIRRANLIGQHLRNGDLDRELSVQFQPIVDTHRHEAVGFEALARWHNPIVGVVPPDEFIVVAERLGIVSQLSQALLKKTLAHVKDWASPLRVSFNLSVRDLISSESVSSIIDIVRQSSVDPARIDFEITETSLMSEFAKANDTITSLRKLGCGVSLDDFGTGHSSLSYVHHLRLDKIKIDKSFVEDLETNAMAVGVVKTIVDMTRNLEIDCIAEGVETQAQLIRLRQLGCRLMQGYLFSKPVAAESVAEVAESLSLILRPEVDLAVPARLLR